MDSFVIENLRLKELRLVVNRNRAFFAEFLVLLSSKGYETLQAFIADNDQDRPKRFLREFFAHQFAAPLLDGLGRPYAHGTANWYFITWVLRDAPAQRLNPLLGCVPGGTTAERRIELVDRLRRLVAPLFPDAGSWDWPALAEVFLARLEGSRRALKGGLFENIVRSALLTILETNKIRATVGTKEVRLNDETYDVEVIGASGRLLIPVKTRETMGGGHAMLFTRDIHKSISVAADHGLDCVPVVIAESWGGDLDALPCKHSVYLKLNPNQVERVQPMLLKELEKLVPVLRALE